MRFNLPLTRKQDTVTRGKSTEIERIEEEGQEYRKEE